MPGLATIALALLHRFWRPLAALLAGLAAYWKGHRDAVADARHQADEHAREALKDRAAVDDGVRRLPADERRRRLRAWARKP